MIEDIVIVFVKMKQQQATYPGSERKQRFKYLGPLHPKSSSALLRYYSTVGAELSVRFDNYEETFLDDLGGVEQCADPQEMSGG